MRRPIAGWLVYREWRTHRERMLESIGRGTPLPVWIVFFHSPVLHPLIPAIPILLPKGCDLQSFEQLRKPQRRQFDKPAPKRRHSPISCGQVFLDDLVAAVTHVLVQPSVEGLLHRLPAVFG